MPGLNRRGPSGSGPKTGRGMGLCRNSTGTQEFGQEAAQGFGMGRRSGSRGGIRGRQRNRFYFDGGPDQPVVEEFEDLSWVKKQIQSLGQVLERIEARISGKSDLVEK